MEVSDDKTPEEEFFKRREEKYKHRERKEFKKDLEEGEDPDQDEELKKDQKEYRRYRHFENSYKKRHGEEGATFSYVYPSTTEATTPMGEAAPNTTMGTFTMEATTTEAATTTTEATTTGTTSGKVTMEPSENAGESADAVTGTVV